MHKLNYRKSLLYIILLGIFILASLFMINHLMHIPLSINSALLLLPILYFKGYVSSASNVEYNETEIVIHKLFQAPASYRWKDISHVVEKKFWGTFQFSDQIGNDLFAFGNAVNGIGHFIRLLAKKRPNLLNVEVGDTLHARYSSLLPLLFIITAMGIFIAYAGPIAACIGIPFITVSAYLLILSPYKLILGREKLVLKTIRKSYEFPAKSIKSIRLNWEDPIISRPKYSVVIENYEGLFGHISLFGRSEFILYLQIRSWFDAVKSHHPN